jgi:hypothetical protein
MVSGESLTLPGRAGNRPIKSAALAEKTLPDGLSLPQ